MYDISNTMTKLSFKEYYEAKQQLLKASTENVRSVVDYSVTKYCKVPVVGEGSLTKEYIPFKPKDKIRILWEYDEDNPILKRFTIFSEDASSDYIPCWSSNKLFEWTNSNCKQDN